MNTYGYVGGNPVIAIDNAGLDAAVVNITNAVYDKGHNAILIGDQDSGWESFSKSNDSQKVENKKYDSLQQFFDAHPEYDRGWVVQTDELDDKKMIEYGRKHLNEAYDLLENNCADLVNGILDAGGKDARGNSDSDGGKFSLFENQPGTSIGGVTVPNKSYESWKVGQPGGYGVLGDAYHGPYSPNSTNPSPR